MALPTATYISQLDPDLPDGDLDTKAEGDDWLRLIQAVLQAQFPNLGAAPVTSTASQLSSVAALVSMNTATNVSELVSYLAQGYVRLMPDTVYTLTAQLVVGSNCGIIGDRSSVIYAPSSVFTNTTTSGRYSTTGVIIDASGLTSGAYTPTENVILSGFTIQSQVVDGRKITAIAARNTVQPLIEGVEIYGLPDGCGIRAASVVGGRIQNNYVHDCTTNVDYGGDGMQITGIEVDNDIINGVYSSQLVITGNIIEDLTVGATALAAHGYQTDGINVVNHQTTNLVIANNNIRNVGEGIDHFGSNCALTGNVIKDAYIFGIKLIHGASHNAISGGSIDNPGLGGVGIYGSTTSGVGDTAYNTVTGVTISNLNADQVWNASSNACVLFADNGGTTGKPVGNLVTGCVLDEGTYGVYGWLDSSTGTTNYGEGNRIVAGAANSRRVLVSGGGGSCRLAGSGTYSTDLV